MKKLLLIAMAMMATLTAKAETKQYTDQLVVTVDGNVTSMTATVEVEFMEDDYIDFRLNNFVLAGDGADKMYVGNIVVSNLYLTQKDGYQKFSYNANLMITPGNIEGVDEASWVGPIISPVPVVMDGTLAGDKLYVNIDINMVSLSQIIKVQFGQKFVADPTVVDTKNFTETISSKMISTDYESYGEVMELDNRTYTTKVDYLSNGEISIQLNDIILSLGDVSMPFGTIVIPSFEPLNRGAYSDITFEDSLLVQGNAELGDAKALVSLRGTLSDTKLFYMLTVDYGEDLASSIYSFQFSSDFVSRGVTGTKSYVDNLTVTVNEESTDPIEATVVVEHLENGGINFALNNFIMELEGNEMYVGNIFVSDIPLYKANKYDYFHFNGNIEISAGADDSQFWIGPSLGIIPLRMKGRLTDNILYVTIDIYMETLSQTISVTFGSEMPTGISTVDAEMVNGKRSNGGWYDLSGRRVLNPTKGLYIVNGKKVIR